MASPSVDDLDGVDERLRFPDGSIVHVFCTRTERDASPSGWAYRLHYGMTDPDPPATLADGTILRYDNAHEATKGHERHAAPDPEPEIIEFPGMAALWERFWDEIPEAADGIDLG